MFYESYKKAPATEFPSEDYGKEKKHPVLSSAYENLLNKSTDSTIRTCSK